MKKNRLFTIVLYVVMMVLLLSWVLGLFSKDQDAMPYSEVVALFENEQVREFVVKGEQITMNLYSPYNGDTRIVATLAEPEVFRNEMGSLLRQQHEEGILTSYHFLPGKAISPYDYILPIILAGLVLLLVWMFLMGRANSNNPMQNFGKARTQKGLPGNKKVTFADVAGVEEEKAELQEVVDFLRNPDPAHQYNTLFPRKIFSNNDLPFPSLSQNAHLSLL